MSLVCRGYIRVSTEEQAKEGYSLEAQTHTLRKYAEGQGWTLAEPIYVDEGLTAKTLKKRDGLRRLLEDLRPGEVVLFWKLDRLNRNLRNSEWFFDEVERRKATYFSITEPMLSTAGPGGRFVRQIMGAVAELYSGILGENVRHGMAQMARQGRFFGGSAPLGYCLTDGKLVPDEHADTVRRIYNMYVQGKGIRSICATLNAEGLRTPRGNEWSHHPVSHILQNQVYVGRIAYGLRENRSRKRPGGPLVVSEGEHEAIINPDLWQQVQEILHRRKRLPSRQVSGDYPLTGVLRCGLCGAALRGLKRKRGRTEVKFWRREYWCYRRTNTGNCRLHAMMADRLEEAWLTALEQWVDSEELRALVNTTADPKIDTAHAERELAEVERKLMRWSNAYESGAIELPEYQSKVTPLREQRKNLQTALQLQAGRYTHRSAEEWRSLVYNVRAVWNESPPERRKELAHSLGMTVTVHPEYQVRLG